jgi:DNA mismatch repair protein MutS
MLKRNQIEEEMQMSFFNLDDPLLEEIKEEILNLDINHHAYGGIDETQ